MSNASNPINQKEEEEQNISEEGKTNTDHMEQEGPLQDGQQKPMLRGEVGACRITQLTSTVP